MKKVDEGGVQLNPAEKTKLIAFLKTLTAVSYTHLRAHETVLDLVCRLLLENKNNNRKKLTNRVNLKRTIYTCHNIIC